MVERYDTAPRAVTVLALSATYIDLPKLACSLLTVVLSGQIIGWVQRIGANQ